MSPLTLKLLVIYTPKPFVILRIPDPLIVTVSVKAAVVPVNPPVSVPPDRGK